MNINHLSPPKTPPKIRLSHDKVIAFDIRVNTPAKIFNPTTVPTNIIIKDIGFVIFIFQSNAVDSRLAINSPKYRDTNNATITHNITTISLKKPRYNP